MPRATANAHDGPRDDETESEAVQPTSAENDSEANSFCPGLPPYRGRGYSFRSEPRPRFIIMCV